jgi:hypothetical protein
LFVYVSYMHSHRQPKRFKKLTFHVHLYHHTRIYTQ